MDVLVDLSPLDTFSRYSGTGRYVNELGIALARLSPPERRNLDIRGLGSIDGQDVLVPLDWPGSSDIRWEGSQEVQWLNARRTRLPGTLRRLHPRVFHATYHMGTPRGTFVPRVVSCLDLVRLVLHQDYLPGRPYYRRLLHAAEALRFHSARRVLAISQHTADDAMRLLKIPASKIDVVHLGVDLERYRVFTGAEAEAAEAVLARCGLRRGRYMFYMGAADPRKNVDTLIAAFARAKLDDMQLLVIGKMRPSDDALIERALREAGHPSSIKLTGRMPEDDLPAIIWGARAFVFCSTYEGFGNVPIEAMACGCPVITTGLTSMKETVGDAGLIVPPRDVAATADAIRRIATDDALHADLARAGLARAARFSWTNTALGTVDRYERALRS